MLLMHFLPMQLYAWFGSSRQVVQTMKQLQEELVEKRRQRSQTSAMVIIDTILWKYVVFNMFFGITIT